MNRNSNIKISAVIKYTSNTEIQESIKSALTISEELIIITDNISINTIKEESNIKIILKKNCFDVARELQKICQNYWILNLEAGETISNDLQDEINFIFKSGLADKYIAYTSKILIKRNILFSFYSLKLCSYKIILFNKNFYNYENIEIKHYKDVEDDKIYKLDNPIFLNS